MIPLLSTRYRQLHKDFLPQHRRFVLEQRLDDSLLQWFRLILPWLEEVDVDTDLADGGVTPSQLLLAAAQNPRLRRLTVVDPGSPAVLGAIGSFSQLKELSLPTWVWTVLGDAARWSGVDVQCLSGSQSLEVGALPQNHRMFCCSWYHEANCLKTFHCTALE